MSNPRPPAMPFCTTTARPVTKFRPRISPNPQNQTAAPATPASPQHTPALHPCQSLAIRSEKTTALFEHGHGTNSIPGPRGHSPAQGTQPCPGDAALPRAAQPCPGDTALPRGRSPAQGTQPCPGDTARSRGHSPAQGTHRLHTSPPRIERTVQILHIMVAPTVVTVRPEGWPRGMAPTR
jgi:hypothetical protein